MLKCKRPGVLFSTAWHMQSAQQVVAANGTLVFLGVLSELRQLNRQFSHTGLDFMDVKFPDIVISVFETLVNTLPMDGREQRRMVLPVIEHIVQDTPNVEVQAAGRAVLNSLAHAHPFL